MKKDAGGLCISKQKKSDDNGCQVKSDTRTRSRRYTVSAPLPSLKYKNTLTNIEHKSLPTYLKTTKNVVKINNFTYDTGRYIIQDNKKFPILLNISFKKNVLDIQIPYPKDYKKTNLMKKVSILGRIIISVFEDQQDYLYLNLFYLYTQVYSKYATIYEKEAFKGIGKLILCFALQYIMDELNIDIINKNIKLSAEGGIVCNNEIATYPYSIEKIKNYLKKYYSSDPDIMYYVDRKKDDPSSMLYNNDVILRNLYCIIENERKLVKYYAKYGFKIISYDDDDMILLDATTENINSNMHLIIHYKQSDASVKMQAKVKDVINSCGNKI